MSKEVRIKMGLRFLSRVSLLGGLGMATVVSFFLVGCKSSDRLPSDAPFRPTLSAEPLSTDGTVPSPAPSASPTPTAAKP